MSDPVGGPARLVRSSEVPGATPGAGWPGWFRDVHAGFRHQLLTPAGYPCHFGANGELADHNWFTACDAGEPAADLLAASLRAFAVVASTGAKRQSLIAFIGPPGGAPDGAPGGLAGAGHSLSDDAARFWDLLGQVGERDQSPWPDGRPQDPGAPDWQWCFGGVPWFVIGFSPGYRSRRSRNLGPCLTMAFQLSERVFDGLSGSTPAGQAAKRQVRDRLASYDAIGPHPHLGDPLHSSTHKWRQYFLPDDNEIADPLACPLAGRAAQGSASQ